MESYGGHDENRILIDAWLQVSLEKKAVATELATRARNSSVLSLRQRQLVPKIVDHSLSALELLSTGWARRQALWVGSSARSLYEVSVVAAYVLQSQAGAELLPGRIDRHPRHLFKLGYSSFTPRRSGGV